MHINDKVMLYRWATVVLVVALIAVISLWLSARNSVENVNDDFQSNVADYRTEIAQTCVFTATTTLEDRRACEELLAEFSEVLREYRNKLVDLTGTSTIPNSTTSTTTVDANIAW